MDKTRIKILVVDDEQGLCAGIQEALKREGYIVDASTDPISAASLAERQFFNLVISDVKMPQMTGLELLSHVRSRNPETIFILMTAYSSVESAVEAMKQGAYDYLPKPIDLKRLRALVQKALEFQALVSENKELKERLQTRSELNLMAGESEPMRAVGVLVAEVANSDVTVLIEGESGTGKELVARAIHSQSPRQQRPFISVNCAALTEPLLEAELFGHAKGAFTGAIRDQPGLFSAADGGTLFLDEVADLSPAAQVKLLRALESGEILPVGAERPSRVDVRIISATNQDLSALRHSGHFREDLFWRIRGAEITLPPLRERAADIPLLAAHFLNQAAALTRLGQPPQLTPATLEALSAHPWPGNLRELRHEMQRASVLIGNRSFIDIVDLSLAPPAASAQSKASVTLQDQVEALERAAIERALTEHHGNRTHAAEALGLSRQGLLKKMGRYG